MANFEEITKTIQSNVGLLKELRRRKKIVENDISIEESSRVLASLEEEILTTKELIWTDFQKLSWEERKVNYRKNTNDLILYSNYNNYIKFYRGVLESYINAVLIFEDEYMIDQLIAKLSKKPEELQNIESEIDFRLHVQSLLVKNK